MRDGADAGAQRAQAGANRRVEQGFHGHTATALAAISGASWRLLQSRRKEARRSAPLFSAGHPPPACCQASNTSKGACYIVVRGRPTIDAGLYRGSPATGVRQIVARRRPFLSGARALMRCSGAPVIAERAELAAEFFPSAKLLRRARLAGGERV